MTTKELIEQLRMESGQREGCPVCGSRAFDEDAGCCLDCGLDLEEFHHDPPVKPMPLPYEQPYAVEDPKHPDHHSIMADIWDNRDKFS